MLDFPLDCKAVEEQLAYVLAVKEKLRLWHNDQAKMVKLSDFKLWVLKEWEPRMKSCFESENMLCEKSQKWWVDQAEGSLDILGNPRAFKLGSIASILAAKTPVPTKWDNSIEFIKLSKAGTRFSPDDPPEDLTTWTEQDNQNRLSETSSAVTLLDNSDMYNYQYCYLYKDAGVGAYPGNFSIYFDFKRVYAGGADAPAHGHLTLGTTLGDIGQMAKSCSAGEGTSGGRTWFCAENAWAYSSLWSPAWTTGVQYYNKFVRDTTVGTYGTIYYYIYTDSARTTLFSSGSLALHSVESYRYIYAPCGWYRGLSGWLTGYVISNVDLAWVPPSTMRLHGAFNRGMA